jgi:hypothetical protein
MNHSSALAEVVIVVEAQAVLPETLKGQTLAGTQQLPVAVCLVGKTVALAVPTLVVIHLKNPQ